MITEHKQKPKVKLLGYSGNSFAILGQVSRSAKKAGWSQERLNKFQEEAVSGDYDHLLRVVMEHFDVE